MADKIKFMYIYSYLRVSEALKFHSENSYLTNLSVFFSDWYRKYTIKLFYFDYMLEEYYFLEVLMYEICILKQFIGKTQVNTILLAVCKQLYENFCAV